MNNKNINAHTHPQMANNAAAAGLPAGHRVGPVMPAAHILGGHYQPVMMTRAQIYMAHHCAACMFGPDGVIKSKLKGQNIVDQAAHEALGGHQDRVAAGRHLIPAAVNRVVAVGSWWIRAPNTRTHRCEICSLGPDGTPRQYAAHITDSTINDHLNGFQHGRRVTEIPSRYQAWHRAGVPRP